MDKVGEGCCPALDLEVDDEVSRTRRMGIVVSCIFFVLFIYLFFTLKGYWPRINKNRKKIPLCMCVGCFLKEIWSMLHPDRYVKAYSNTDEYYML